MSQGNSNSHFHYIGVRTFVLYGASLMVHGGPLGHGRFNNPPSPRSLPDPHSVWPRNPAMWERTLEFSAHRAILASIGIVGLPVRPVSNFHAVSFSPLPVTSRDDYRSSQAAHYLHRRSLEGTTGGPETRSRRDLLDVNRRGIFTPDRGGAKFNAD